MLKVLWGINSGEGRERPPEQPIVHWHSNTGRWHWSLESKLSELSFSLSLMILLKWRRSGSSGCLVFERGGRKFEGNFASQPIQLFQGNITSVARTTISAVKSSVQVPASFSPCAWKPCSTFSSRTPGASTMMSCATLGKRDSAMYFVTTTHWPWVRHQNLMRPYSVLPASGSEVEAFWLRVDLKRSDS